MLTSPPGGLDRIVSNVFRNAARYIVGGTHHSPKDVRFNSAQVMKSGDQTRSCCQSSKMNAAPSTRISR